MESTSFASPSPRGWTFASNALIKAKEYKILDIDTITQIVSGFVGTSAGLRFKIWYEYYRKFDPFIYSLIENNVMTLDYDNLNKTEQLIFIISTCFHAKQKTLDSKNDYTYLSNLCNFIKKYKVPREMQVIALHNSFSFDMIAKEKLYKCAEFFELFKDLSEHLTFKK